jgi:serine phosphatase RsbU (regulator of sigma subunit)/anti-sigma regulatory factor (Ser/Thr protein kinase)
MNVSTFRQRKNNIIIISVAALLLEMISAVQYYYTRGMLTAELEKLAETELRMKAILIKGIINANKDVSLKELSDTLNVHHTHPSSYNLLLSETGKILVKPSADRNLESDIQQVVSLINDSSVARKSNKTGRIKIIRYKSLKSHHKGSIFFCFMKGQPHWQLALVCYDHEAFKQLYWMRLNMLILMLAGMGILLFIIKRFVNNHNDLLKASIKEERLEKELQIASNIQKEMLPVIEPDQPVHRDIDIFGILHPAKEVGGDLFDFLIRNEKLFFCIGDVSGKGIPASLVMSVIHTQFHMATAHESNPAIIMQTLNQMSCEGNKSNIFVTLFIGVLDLPTGRLRYCNAGHEIPWIVGSDKENGNLVTRQLEVKANLPIGLFDDFHYEMEETLLTKGELLFLYTDGLTEAKSSSRKLFGTERLNQILIDHRSLRAADLLTAMANEVHQFQAGTEQSDDLTMLAIRYLPATETCILQEQLTLRNDIKQVALLTDFIKSVASQLQMDLSMTNKIRLSVEEAVVNIMEYAYPPQEEGDIHIDVCFDGHKLKIIIRDNGQPFDPTGKNKADTSLSVEDRPIGGLGILLVSELMDTVNYERTNGENILTLQKRIDSPLNTIEKQTT